MKTRGYKIIVFETHLVKNKINWKLDDKKWMISENGWKTDHHGDDLI